MRIGPPCFVTAAIVLGTTAPLSAQSSPPDGRPTTPRPVSIRVFANAGYKTFLAEDSFNAIVGEAAGAIRGGGTELTVSERWFVRVAAWRYRAVGERVFHFRDQLFMLGIPTTVRVDPVDISGGYRFGRRWPIATYVGAGVSSYRYREVSDFAEAGDNVDRRRRGYHALGGAEARIWRRLSTAAEFQYSRVPRIIGDGGISQESGESDLGGGSAGVNLILRVW